MNALTLLFYRIITFFTRVPRKTREKHSLIFKDFSGFSDSYIEKQTDYSDLPFGKGNFSDNGCGPIALYNALLAVGKESVPSISSIISFLEHKGAVFGGRFGTSPFAIIKYIRNCGYDVTLFKKKNPDMLNEFSKTTDDFISIVQMNRESLKNGGLHFIHTHKNEDGTFTSHNPHMYGNTLFETLNSCSVYDISHICTIGIIKNRPESDL